MMLFKYTILKKKEIVRIGVFSKATYDKIVMRDGNRLGIKKRTINSEKFLKEHIKLDIFVSGEFNIDALIVIRRKTYKCRRVRIVNKINRKKMKSILDNSTSVRSIRKEGVANVMGSKVYSGEWLNFI